MLISSSKGRFRVKIISRFFRRAGKKPAGILDFPEVRKETAREFIGADFRFGLLRLIWESGSGKNICLSPFSLGSILAMLYGGAEGETKRAIAKTMGLEDIPAAELDLRYLRLLDSWKALSPGAAMKLNIASSLWTGIGFPIREDFRRRVRESYCAETGELDFAGAPAESVGAINSWVHEKTQRRISSIIGVDDVSLETRLILANAVYFKGLWSAIAEFDPRMTRKEGFHLLDGSEKKVQMMRRPKEHDLDYYQDDGFQAVILPYKDTTFQMALFLPDERAGLGEFLQDLTAENWARWMSGLEPAPVDLVLPRFRLESHISIKNVLSALGMDITFRREADFSGICSEKLWIDQVLHRAFLEVDEEGTEAAAVTAAVMRKGISDRFSMIFDHPFFCTIRDSRMDEILFAAAVVDPGV
jgi:serine protease inhibitor